MESTSPWTAVAGEDEEVRMARVACIGECMLELSGTGRQSMSLSYGGDSLNTCVYLARLGVGVDYVTALGDDPYSDWMIAQWQAEGVGTALVVRAAGRLPGLYAIRTDDNGERRFFYWRDRAPARDLFAFPESAHFATALADCDWIYLTGVTLSLYCEDQRRRLYELLDAHRASGGKVAFDSNYRPRGWRDAAAAQAAMEGVLSRVDLAAPTLEDERMVFGDEDAEACAERLHAAGVAEVVVKQGPEGCVVSATGLRDRVKGVCQPAPVDTTGAGDSFNAAYLAARLGGAGPVDAARRANELAAAVIMHPGAVMPRSAMPGEAG